MITRAHQTVTTDARALHAVAFAIQIAVVVHVRETAEQMPVLMAESADTHLVGAESETREQVEICRNAPVLQINKRIMRPDFSHVLRLPSIKNIERVKNSLAARVVSL